MSIQAKNLFRSGLLIVGAMTAASCGDDGPSSPESVSVALSLSASVAYVEQGGNTAVQATVTRDGPFSGEVTFALIGVPTGVTALVSNVQSAGAVTKATVTLSVDATFPAGNYAVRVVGTSGDGKEAAATYMLIVMPPPGYSIIVAAAQTINQGGDGSGTTITLTRSRFTDAVVFTVENLPPGVYASFHPQSSPPVSAFDLYLWAASDAVPGVYNNLLVRGVAPGLEDRTSPLTLTVRPAPFTLALPSPTLSMVRGGAPQTITVSILRNSFPREVTLYIDQGDEGGTLPAGITATFEPSVTTGNSTTLTFTLGAAAAPGNYDLYLWGQALSGEWWWYAPLRLTVTAAP